MATTITIQQDDQGAITVDVDGQQYNAEDEEDTLAIVAEALIGGEGEEPNPEQPEGEPQADQPSNELPMSEEDFAGGFKAVRAGGLNGGR